MGCNTAPLLEAVLKRFSNEPTWRPLLGELLQNVDDVSLSRMCVCSCFCVADHFAPALIQVLEQRLKDTGSTAHHRSERLRYGARLYRLLAAIIKAAASAAWSTIATLRAPPLSGHRRQLPLPTPLLMQLAQRMAMLALESFPAVKEEAAAMVACGPAADSLDAQLRGKGVLRQSLQAS